MKKILKQLAKKFELILYTSGENDYAKAALNAIEKDYKYFQHKLSKDQCMEIPDLEFHTKDLRILLSNRDIKDIIVVENQVCNFMLQITNVIPIKDFHGDRSDQ